MHPDPRIEDARVDSVEGHVVQAVLSLVVAAPEAVEGLGLFLQLLFGHLPADVDHPTDLQGLVRHDAASASTDAGRGAALHGPALVSALHLDDSWSTFL